MRGFQNRRALFDSLSGDSLAGAGDDLAGGPMPQMGAAGMPMMGAGGPIGGSPDGARPTQPPPGAHPGGIINSEHLSVSDLVPAPGTDIAPTPGPGPSPPPVSSAPARDFSRLTGYNEDKFNNADHTTAKYQMGRVLSGFDSRQGITPEVLAGLNELGFGSFSGKGDKLSLSGLTDKGRQANLQGDYKDADFNVGFKSGNGLWGYSDPVAEARDAASAGMTGAGAGGAGVTGVPAQLSGDPLAQIQEALGKYSNSPNLQALLAQLGQA